MKPQILSIIVFCGAYTVMVSGILPIVLIDPVTVFTKIVIALIKQIIILLEALTNDYSDAINSVIIQWLCTLFGCVFSLLTMVFSTTGLFGFYASLAFPIFNAILPDLLNAMTDIPVLSNVNQNIYIPCAMKVACIMRDIARNAPPNSTSARDLKIFVEGLEQFFSNVNRTFTCPNNNTA